MRVYCVSVYIYVYVLTTSIKDEWMCILCWMFFAAYCATMDDVRVLH